MIKTVTIGDVHGRRHWEKLNPKDYDLMIFVGDYTDSFTKSNLEIKSNLLNIIELKNKYTNKVILLLGNHDLPYYQYFVGTNKGFRIEAWVDLHKIFSDNKNLFKCAFQIDNYLWTHAGVNQGWYDTYIVPVIEEHNIEGNLADKLNKLFETNYKPLHYYTSDRGGFADYGGPFWSHWTEMVKIPLKDYHQIFGHTPGNFETVSVDSKTSVTIVDPADEIKFYKLNI